MESRYDFRTIEKKWRAEWEKNPINKEDAVKPKFYCLDMFPYPSGSGLHVGHWRGYVLSDVVSRYKVLQGYQVLHPMGWDAFGLPAENYAIKTNTHPRVSTDANIKNAKRQLHEISAIYDWDKEVDTTDPKYYKWTQWIFVQMFKKGLAYEKEMPLNWCPKCKCVLANEEAAGGVHERCGTVVTKKNLRQWMLKITAYADRLLEDLNKLDWSDKVKKMQTDWIGKSYGAEVDFKLTGSDDKITVYTTRPDTLHGCTFMVLAPEYEGLAALTTAEQKDAVEKYCYEASTKSAVDRMTNKEKTGVFTGSYCVNPVNGKEIPIWVADYVLADYGTGAIMCVPAHDDRDFEFAKKFNIPIIQVVVNNHVLGMVRQWQNLFYGQRYSATVLNDAVDFVKLAEAMGAKAIRITKMEEVEPALKEALACPGPIVLDCMIDQDLSVFPMVPAGASIDDIFDEEDMKNNEQSV